VAPAERPPRDAPRVFAKTRNVWVRSAPTSDVQWIGMLWLGGSAKVRGPERVAGAGCGGEWTPIEPRGWVCVDGERATLDPSDPVLLALYPLRPRVETPWPHRYALVPRTVRRHDDLPGGLLTPSEAPTLPRDGAGLLRLPSGLLEGRRQMVGRSALAYVDAYRHGERTVLLAPDMSWVDRDEVEPVEPVTFMGLELSGAVALPLAFFRGAARPAFRRAPDGTFREVPGHFARLSHVLLAEEKVSDGRAYYQRVRDSDLWVHSRSAVIPTPRASTPWGAPVGEPDTTGLAPKGRATWLEVSILGGWLVAFEGTRAVYATMISAGRGGGPVPGKDPLETASTPTGRFSISGKFKTATMESSSTPIVHGDVPWTQNFSGPHALHSAYWHDDWGSLKSAGCVNLAPRDGRWLFDFTEPEVPEGWHGVRYLSRYGGATRVLIDE
jgi:hypothetical protein